MTEDILKRIDKVLKTREEVYTSKRKVEDRVQDNYEKGWAWYGRGEIGIAVIDPRMIEMGIINRSV